MAPYFRLPEFRNGPQCEFPELSAPGATLGRHWSSPLERIEQNEAAIPWLYRGVFRQPGMGISGPRPNAQFKELSLQSRSPQVIRPHCGLRTGFPQLQSQSLQSRSYREHGRLIAHPSDRQQLSVQSAKIEGGCLPKLIPPKSRELESVGRGGFEPPMLLSLGDQPQPSQPPCRLGLPSSPTSRNN